ncbi:energy transducer TonB, partial [Bdellovibrionales bacterium]|nr:energy transducer TonB [Bdellovibrionales bacterium]
EVLPLVRIEPQYPRKAAMSGKQGWVLLKFDITPMGSVNQIEILDSKPRRIFNMAAKRALLKWKYRPKIVDGKAVSQLDNKVRIEFRLEG